MATLGATFPIQVPHGSTLYPITMLGAHDPQAAQGYTSV